MLNSQYYRTLQL